MQNKTFNYSIADSQGTKVKAIQPEAFDYGRYQEYEALLLEENHNFWANDAGVAVYRRFRAPEVFSYGCQDMKNSLALQLGALNESMNYKMDIANFLEPWYGIGTIGSAFGLTYQWHQNQAPATQPAFKNVKEAMAYEVTPVDKTKIGRHTLEMIEYFMDQTKGKLPISFTDTQSPLNIAASLVEINQFFMDFYERPEELQQLLELITDLSIDFTKKQLELIGDALALPGHGFASSRKFTGVGMSDDMIIMLSPQLYEKHLIPCVERFGNEFGGPVFHSCGNWANKIAAVKKITNLAMVDGAFSAETDPDPNQPEPFGAGFAGTGVVVNARIVGDADTVASQVKKIWQPGLKLIVVTYCETADEQLRAYHKIHEICDGN